MDVVLHYSNGLFRGGDRELKKRMLLLPMLLLLLLLPRAATLACYSSTPLFRRWFQA